MPPNVALIIPAAGEGRRMKSRTHKPFLSLGDRSVLQVTLERFQGMDVIGQVILALGPADIPKTGAVPAEMASLGVTDVVPGGATRTQSVSNALGALADAVDTVLIHDAVRPFVSASVIEGVIEAAGRTGAAIAAVPVKDTVKDVEGGIIRRTVPREGLYLAQTPQGFRREVIEAVQAQGCPEAFTDDAGLVEKIGGRVEIVESTYLNFKITTPEDLALARAVLRAFREGDIVF
ncbi:MAG: 2-C-methyl-D-erythritol 4-phosphate cytidylyltransferase [Planctomycetes bacterium]|nr:2-C-methyl-D-erythritol 4-phosphate cytidylyltransferase [Planctomycetota bacterium]